MNDQETRQKLADAILRGEAVCYGMTIELSNGRLCLGRTDRTKPGWIEHNHIIGFPGGVEALNDGLEVPE